MYRLIHVSLLITCGLLFSSWMPHGLPPAAVSCNFITGVATGIGAGTCATTPGTCNNVANDTPAFDSFLNWANNTWQPAHPGLLIELVIPTGKNCLTNTSTAVLPPQYTTGAFITYGVKRLRISAAGATLTAGAANFQLGSAGICHRGIADANGCSARINTVAKGATSVTLTAGSLASGYASRFVVGQYALVTGFELQGGAEYPSNPHYFDFVKITGVNAGTGVVSFSGDSLRYTYKSTWPMYFAGDAFESDTGGPATIYALDPKWDLELDVRGLTFNVAASPGNINNNGKNVSYNNVNFSGASYCAIPSQNLNWTANNSDFSACTMEVDKIVGTISINRTTINAIDFQSSSTDNFYFTNSTATNFIHGTPKYANISGSTIADFRPGAIAYGRSDEVVCSNSTITSFSAQGIIELGPSNAGVNHGFTMVGGVIGIPSSYGNVARWAVPGTNLFWGGQFASETVFQALDVTCSGDCTVSGGGTILVQTSLPLGFPSVPLSGGALGIQVHPAPKFTSTNCAGLEYLQGGTAQAPLYSYTTRTLSGTGLGLQSSPTTGYPIWGVPTSLSWNVTTAYTGGGALSLHALATFDNYGTVDTVTYAGGTYGPQINLKQIGNRVSTATAVTCNGVAGSCSGDSLSAPGATKWFATTYSLAGSADISGTCSASPSAGCPTVTLTLQTNQGVVYP